MTAIPSSVQMAGTNREDIYASKLLWAAPLTGALAAVVNTVIYSVYGAMGFTIVLPLPSLSDPTQTSTPLMLPFVVIFSFLPALAAGVLLWALSKLTRRPLTYFVGISVVALILSFGASMPLDMPAAFKIGLDVMHVAAALVIVGGLTMLVRKPNADSFGGRS